MVAIFFNLLPRQKEQRKINKWDLIKIQNFCTAKETTDKIKRQLTECKRIFTNGVPGKGTVSKIYKEFTQFNIQKILNSQIKWAEDMNRHFFKEGTQMANRHM